MRPALLFGAWVVAKAVLRGNPVAGYFSLLVVLLLSGVQFVTLGVIGEHLGRVLNEAKNRPIRIPERHLPCRADEAPRPAAEARAEAAAGRAPVQPAETT